MRYFILILFLVAFITNSFGFESIDVINPNYEIQNQQDDFPITNEELSNLEMKIFDKTFENELGLNRLKRLEKEVFGMEQMGKIDERFELLAKVSEYYKKNDTAKVSKQNEHDYYDNSNVKYYDSDDNLKTKKSKFQQFLDSVVDSFTYGTMTGYTPPMNYYNNLGGMSGYLPSYYHPYNNRFGNYRKNSAYYPHPPPPKPPKNHNNNSFYGQPMRNFNAGMGIRMID